MDFHVFPWIHLRFYMYLIDFDGSCQAGSYLRVKKLVIDFCFVLPGGDGCLVEGCVSILGISLDVSSSLAWEGSSGTSFSSQVLYSLFVTKWK